jgi:peptidoglycan/xylan/chitin deacetylase (PgdA/CDA1 family)
MLTLNRPTRAAKELALNIGFRMGYLRARQLVRRHQALILMFHRFGDGTRGDPQGLPIKRFAQYMRYLTARYRVVSLRELVHDLERGGPGINTAAVTIDDGYDDVFSLAAPVLRRYGIPASIFVVSGFAAGRLWPWPDHFRFVFERAARGPVRFKHRATVNTIDIRDERDRRRYEEQWREYAKTLPAAEREDLLAAIAEAYKIDVPATAPAEFRSISWTALRALAAEGFDIGGHTRSHPILSRIESARLRDEIHGCKEEIEAELRQPVSYFAYPNGRREDYTQEAVSAVSKAGYAAALTAIPGNNTRATPRLELLRIPAGTDSLARFAQAISGIKWNAANDTEGMDDHEENGPRS